MSKLLALWLPLLFTSVTAQNISFNINVLGNNIGRMDITHTIDKDGNDFYAIVSKSKAKLLWIVKENFSRFEATYKNGKLLSSSHFESENDKTKRWTKVKYDGKQYQVESFEQPSRSFKDAPDCSDISIYFTDIKDIKRIFYLPDASFYQPKLVDKNCIEFKSADGHRNIYFFENGRIKAMEFRLTLATVYMTRI